ncbi:MAG: hypothetical protein M1818_005799 [Claussenomyces sp. TS43310]|nr:MAG: hypothetical protein M1818_005799 [Claussenomyces sp. TS43310]
MTSTEPTPQDVAAKARILSHMNSDHQRELSHYLQHWAHLSARASSSPIQLLDMTYTRMDLAARDGTHHRIPIQPALRSWADARLRAAEMDRQARAALGLSDVIVTEYRAPHPVTLIVCALSYISLLLHFRILPGTFFHDRILGYFPGGPSSYLWWQARLGSLIVLVHLVEATYMAVKMKKHDVLLGSKLWWQWVGFNFLEGFPSHLRFDALVAEKKRALEARKQE